MFCCSKFGNKIAMTLVVWVGGLALVLWQGGSTMIQMGVNPTAWNNALIIENKILAMELGEHGIKMATKTNENNTLVIAENKKLEKQLQEHHLPPFRVSSIGKCATRQTVRSISKAVWHLNKILNIRVFPRNGFLLGIIRHGGFLPNENIDSDLGVISTDLDSLNLTVSEVNIVGRFKIVPTPTENNWVNWKGINPISGQAYPFFQVGISSKRPRFRTKLATFYPYRNDNFFYPRPAIERLNYAGNAEEMHRWNKEDANYRLVDTDELVTKENFEKGKQVGTVFPATVRFNCTVEKQFYFTTILVPCDYEAILQSYYGRNWRRVEKRSNWESLQLSEEKSKEFLNNGPLPLCA